MQKTFPRAARKRWWMNPVGHLYLPPWTRQKHATGGQESALARLLRNEEEAARAMQAASRARADGTVAVAPRCPRDWQEPLPPRRLDFTEGLSRGTAPHRAGLHGPREAGGANTQRMGGDSRRANNNLYYAVAGAAAARGPMSRGTQALAAAARSTQR